MVKPTGDWSSQNSEDLEIKVEKNQQKLEDLNSQIRYLQNADLMTKFKAAAEEEAKNYEPLMARLQVLKANADVNNIILNARISSVQIGKQTIAVSQNDICDIIKVIRTEIDIMLKKISRNAQERLSSYQKELKSLSKLISIRDGLVVENEIIGSILTLRRLGVMSK